MTLTQKDRIEARNQVLDDYESTIGLPPNTPPGTTEELQEYLAMDRQSVEAMTPDRAVSISYRLSQFSFYLQRCLNRNKAIKTWTEQELNKVVGLEIQQYDKFTKHEAKVALICKTNSAAKELYDMLTYASQLIDRLSDLSSGIRNLSYVISLVLKSKIGESK